MKSNTSSYKAQLLSIAQLGQETLRTRAHEITKSDLPKVRFLVSDLIATLMDVNGVGIAAPQVFQSLRVFIVASHPNPRYPYAPLIEPFPMINPNILKTSQEIAKDWEGCLSIPGIRGFVPRAKEVVVRYYDTDFTLREESYTGFVARIIQHEYDHLDGVLFIDRLESSLDMISEKEYQRRVTSKGQKNNS